MKRVVLLLGGFCLLVGLSGCAREQADTEESVTRDMAKVMGEVGEALSKVEDEAGAETARPKLEAAAARWANLKQRLELARLNPGPKPPATQTMRQAQIELNVARKFAMAQWVRVSKLKPWGYAYVGGFTDFLKNFTDVAAEPDVRPAAVPVPVS